MELYLIILIRGISILFGTYFLFIDIKSEAIPLPSLKLINIQKITNKTVTRLTDNYCI